MPAKIQAATVQSATGTAADGRLLGPASDDLIDSLAGLTGKAKAKAEVAAKMLPGETVLWHGEPRWQTVAFHIFHVRLVAAYFAAYAIFQTILVGADGGTLAQSAFAGVMVAAIGLPVLAFLAGIAWLVERTTLYTITSKRVVFGIGITLPKTFNIPFKVIQSVSLKTHADGSGNISLKLIPTAKIAGPLLWPHLRPWHLKHPEPTLRGVPNVAALARRLTNALEAAGETASEPAVNAAAATQQKAANAIGAGTGIHRRPHTALPIRLAGMLVLFCGLLVVLHQYTDFGGGSDEASRTAEKVHGIQFVRQDNGQIDVTDAQTGAGITTLQPQNDGLIRGALRNFARMRTLSSLPLDAPFQLTRWSDGHITLSDELTGERVPLDAFGPIGEGATRDLLTLAAQPAAQPSAPGQ